MSVKLLTENSHLEFLSFKGDCTGSSESTLVKLSHCGKSHVAARISLRCTKSEYDQEIPQSHNADQPTVRKSHKTFTITRHP